jgi:ABC-type nitrate/sulfonate/bicarbonate transport system permease component
MRGRNADAASGGRWQERIVLLASLPLFLLVWEVTSRSGVVNSRLFPPPSDVAVATWTWARSGQLWIDLGMSVSRIAVGLTTGTLVGVVLGLATGQVRIIANLLTPIFQILRPIPPIAFVPIVILWFGLSELGKYFLVFWGVFFTVWMSAHLGVRRVDPHYLRAARMLGTPEVRLFREILLPAALPVIFVGIRTAVSIAFYTLVAAELAGTFAGVAYRIDVAQQNLQIGQVMGGLLLLGLVSALSDRLFEQVSRRLVWWS